MPQEPFIIWSTPPVLYPHRALALWADSHRGIYAPRDSIQMLKPEIRKQLPSELIDTLLLGPDQPGYWDAWIAVQNEAIMAWNPDDETVIRVFLAQDSEGVVWLGTNEELEEVMEEY